MKKIISLLAIVCLICCMFPVSAFASSDTEYIRDGVRTGIWYSNPATKEALDKCDIREASFGGAVILIDLRGSRIDIYDDLLLTGAGTIYTYYIKYGTIRCNNCRAINLYDDELNLYLENLTIEGGNATCADDYDMGYGGAIYVDGANCTISAVDKSVSNVDTRDIGLSDEWGDPIEWLSVTLHSYIEDCYARYGGAIAVCGHNCTLENITFKSNTGIDNGGNDLYVYWGDCHVNRCTFDKDQEGAAANITADTYFDNCNITKDMCVGDVHQVYITNSTASILSEGNLWIVIGVAVVAIGGVAALIIVKKKKKTAQSNS